MKIQVVKYDFCILCVFFVTIFCMSLLFCTNVSYATGVYLDFNDFPISTGTVPGNSPVWEYSSRLTNDYGYTESASSGWKSKIKLSDGLHWFFDYNRNGHCYDHMYADTYGYLDIVAKGHTGNALRNVITGGLPALASDTNCGPTLGTSLHNRESFTGPSQVYTIGKVGHSYIYFKKINVIGSSRDVTPYSQSVDSNRFSVYIYLPPEATNGVGGYGNPLSQTYQVGLFQDPAQTGYHHYFNYFTRGGGWTKIQIEETTNGDNGGNGTTRYIPNFLKTTWQWYMTTLPYSGIAIPPYEILIDDISFEKDTYTNQNNVTISNLAVLYKHSDRTFEISFNDKYKKTDAFSTYELRYSFSPITNENWSTATPVSTIADNRFYIQSRNDGKFQKWWPDGQGVWTPFKLTVTDTALLDRGVTIHFAVKDISQTDGNLTVPVNGINGYWGARKGGRPYDLQPANFVYADDKDALPLIKRISYTITTNLPPLTTNLPPLAPQNLKKQ